MIECIRDIEYSRSKDLIDNGVKVKPSFWCNTKTDGS